MLWSHHAEAQASNDAHADCNQQLHALMLHPDSLPSALSAFGEVLCGLCR